MEEFKKVQRNLTIIQETTHIWEKYFQKKIIFKSLRNGKGRLKTKKLNVENKNETNVLQINGNLCSLFCFNLHETCRNFKLFECCFLFLPCLFNEVLNCCILIFFYMFFVFVHEIIDNGRLEPLTTSKISAVNAVNNIVILIERQLFKIAENTVDETNS